MKKEEERKEEEEKKKDREKTRKAKRGRKRSEGEGPRITGRDVEAMGWLTEQRVATVPQVARLLGHLGQGEITDTRARQVVRRWQDLGLAQRKIVWHAEPALVWPSRSGASLGGATRWHPPGVSTLRHSVAVSGVRLRMAPPGRGVEWISEAALRQTCSTDGHIADGGIVFSNGETLAIEVELSPHGRRRVAEAITSLLSARDPMTGRDRWNRVLYLCSPETITQVSAVVGNLPTRWSGRVHVRRLP